MGNMHLAPKPSQLTYVKDINLQCGGGPVVAVAVVVVVVE